MANISIGNGRLIHIAFVADLWLVYGGEIICLRMGKRSFGIIRLPRQRNGKKVAEEVEANFCEIFLIVTDGYSIFPWRIRYHLLVRNSYFCIEK